MLQDTWPSTQITWILGKLEDKLLGHIPGIEFIVFDKNAGARAYRDLRSQLRGRRFDALLHMQLALRASIASLKEGMTQNEVGGLAAGAHRQLGMNGGSLVLFGKDAAYPHGTTTPQPLKAGDAVLLDGGGKFMGYGSDITRTGIFGAKPTDRQRLTEFRRPGDFCRRGNLGVGPL